MPVLIFPFLAFGVTMKNCAPVRLDMGLLTGDPLSAATSCVAAAAAAAAAESSDFSMVKKTLDDGSQGLPSLRYCGTAPEVEQRAFGGTEE